jgi:hypothetical protein
VDNQQELVEKRDKMKQWVSYAGLGAAIVVAGLSFVFLLQALAGLIALAVAGALGIVVVQLAPWFALKVANWKYRLIDAEKVSHVKAVTAAAVENPIETLTNLLLAKRAAFKEFEQNVVTATAARDTFKGKVSKFAERYPARAAEFKAQLDRMIGLVEKKKRALQDAQQSLEDGDMKLEEMKAYWEMSKDAIELNKAAGMDTGDAFEKLKADTACDAVFESMNTAFAQLEVAAALEVDMVDKPAQGVAQLGHSEPVVLEVPVTQTQKVSR